MRLKAGWPRRTLRVLLAMTARGRGALRNSWPLKSGGNTGGAQRQDPYVPLRSHVQSHFQCWIPSKTFLFGEYLTLAGGPALLVCTEPQFTLAAQNNNSNTIDGIPQGSPAAAYLTHHAKDFAGWSLNMTDPHQDQGGFGASSAQFVAVRALHESITQGQDSLDTLLDTYRRCAWDGTGHRPSGADIACQYTHLSQKGPSHTPATFFFYPQQQTYRSQEWPFHDLHYRIIRTGIKVPTHEHLKEPLSFDAQRLHAAACAAWAHFSNANSAGFCAAIMDYHAALSDDGLVHPHTQKLLTQLHQDPAVRAAKGCGALGADVILILERTTPS